MAHKNDRSSFASYITHLAQAFLLKGNVPDGKNLVNEEDFRLEMGGDGEGQPDVHAAGVMLDGRVDEFVDFGEGYDFVELPVDLPLAHPKDRSAQIRILPP